MNLENWMGTGLNRRATDPNNLPPEWSTVYNRFPWGVVCYPCGTSNYTQECFNIWKREWMAELPYSDFIYIYQNLPGTLPFDCTGNLIATPNYVSILNSWGSYILGDTPALSYPNIPINQVVNGWYDLQIGHTCQQGGLDRNPDFTDDNNAKMIQLDSNNSKNYSKEIKACFENKDFKGDIIFENPNGQIIYNESNLRQSFEINNKKTEETGPFAIAGYYPLYDTIKGARFARDNEDTHGYHIHEFNGVEYYMPNGLELGVTQFHGDYINMDDNPEIVLRQQQSISALCSFDDIKKVAGAIMYPVYSTSSQAMSIWYNNFITFQQSMWTHFQNAGCNWWVNRINLWTSQLPNITNAYQLALKNAKIDFAHQMNVACGCPPIPPVAPPSPVLKITEQTIEKVETTQDKQSTQSIEKEQTPSDSGNSY